MSIVTFPVRLFGNIWSRLQTNGRHFHRIRRHLRAVCHYHPILNEPDMLRKELNKQAQSVKTIFQFGNETHRRYLPDPEERSQFRHFESAKKSQDKK